ncbi:MAG: hypothetical protein JWO57_178 [Pseudonocardiales bacterium]|nr:hypothetical protein [Pseudonocardiales bacterium]
MRRVVVLSVVFGVVCSVMAVARPAAVAALPGPTPVPSRPTISSAHAAHVFPRGGAAALRPAIAARVTSAATGREPSPVRSGSPSVRVPTKAFPLGTLAPGPSQGVTESHADTWQTAGQTGAGVKIGIVDGGYAGLDAEVAAGHLPYSTAVAGDHCADVNASQHGTAVAEVVHQMAPDAQLFLYCVDDTIGFAQAAAELTVAGVSIVNSSLGFPGDSRGDGTGPAGSATSTVAAARRAGILWIQAAGNSAQDHWSGSLADTNRNGLAELGCACDEHDTVFVRPGGSASAYLQWDQWPASSADVTLFAQGFQCTNAACSAWTSIDTDPTDADPQTPLVNGQAGGAEPVLHLDFSNSAGTFDQFWNVAVVLGTGLPSVHFDLSYWGDVDGPSYAACQPAAGGSACSAAALAKAAAGSIAEPASSPYAFAVGAATSGADGRTGLESFSSQGPTIDGRVKPDISGWDGVSSYLGDFAKGFYGTSAATPHVTGAAVLIKGQHPQWDAAQIQNYLEQQANSAHPSNPPSNQLGHGTLTLGGAASSTLPAASRYQALASPRRILDTRAGLAPSGNKGALGAATSRTITVSGLPADATAAAINLTGIGARAPTFLSVFPGGTAFPGTSNLNLSPTDPTAAVFAIVTLGTGHRITIRNAQSSVHVAVDLLGYFGTGAEAGRYTPVATNRVLDTRSAVGGHPAPLGAGRAVTVHPGLPGDAGAAIVNITAVNGNARGGFLNAAPTCTQAASTVNFTRYARANLAVVALRSGAFCIDSSGSPVNVIVDVVGYLSGSGGSSYVALPAPVRIVDTRTNNGGSGAEPAPLQPDSSASFRGDGLFAVPYAATALLTGIVDVNATRGGYFTLFPGLTRPAAPASTLNFTTGRVVSNAAIVDLSSDQFGLYNNLGNTDAAVDLFGYFV